MRIEENGAGTGPDPSSSPVFGWALRLAGGEWDVTDSDWASPN